MSLQEKEKISLSFPEEEEIYYFFPIEDLIKEYNYTILKNPSFNQGKRAPLSLSPSNLNSNDAVISPLTEQELQRMRFTELKGNDLELLKNIIKDQVSPKGLLGNVPTIAAGVTLVELIRDIGLIGEVCYKTVEDKTYVILKGHAGQRNFLKGTRYLNTHPEVVRLGLSKVTLKNAAKSGFKASFLVYGAIKATDAVAMILTEGGLKPQFFSEMPAELSKLAINTLVTVGVGGVVALTSVPVAAGIGIVIAVSVTAGIALEYLDQKTGFTQKLSEATERLYTNLKEWWNGSAQIEKKRDPLEGLISGGSFVYKHKQLLQMRGPVVYTA